MTDPELSAMLDTITRKAPALRAAGVTALMVEGVSLTLAQPDPPKDEDKKEPKKRRRESLLDDPVLFGRSDGRVPGFDTSDGDE